MKSFTRFPWILVPTHTVLCARCNVPLEGGADANGSDILSCPACGQHDTVDNVTSEVGKYLAEKMFADMLRSVTHESLTQKSTAWRAA